MKQGDKLYLVTRRDISPGYQAVQSCHALRQFTAEHKDVDLKWFTFSNYLALLVTKDLKELEDLVEKAIDMGIRVSVFHEPDVGGKITAIALEPGERTKKLCEHLPLALKDL